MSSVSSFVVNDKFVITTRKHLATAPQSSWVNTYEVVATGTGTVADLAQMGEDLVAFEQAFHLTNVGYDEIRLATWGNDSKPYNPDTFTTIPLVSFGTKPIVGDVEPLDTTLYVKRLVRSGRQGRLEYRGVLLENEVTSPAGKPTLSNLTSFNDAIAAAQTAHNITTYFEGGSAVLKLAMITKTGTNVRQLTGLVVGGVSNVKADHVFFHKGIRRINGR